MLLYRSTIRVGSVPPPEEILTMICGTCGLWQMCVYMIACFSVSTYTLDLFITNFAVEPVNYICADGNGSKCFDVNGSDCKKFEFFNRQANLTIFTETLLLVCKNEYQTLWMKNFHRLGEIVGFILVGVCVDKFGVRPVFVVLIPFHCLTGLLIMNVSNVYALSVYYFTHAIFGNVMLLCPIIVVCDISPNKLRTLNLGVVSLSSYLTAIAAPYTMRIFSNMTEIIAVNSLVPVILLIPLLFFKNSPNYICFTKEFNKAEQVLRQIADFNRCPLSPDAKIRPMRLIKDHKQPLGASFYAYLKSKKTRRPFLSLLCLSFFLGCYSAIFKYIETYNRNSNWIECSALAGATIGLILLHLIPHKILIGVATFLKSVCITIIYVIIVYWESEKIIPSIVIVVHSSCILLSMCHLSLVNLAPRMYPTEQRTTQLGIYFGLNSLGMTMGTLFLYYEVKWSVFCFVAVSPFLEILLCFCLWDVHRRELPDYLVDCMQFEKYYKPTRYYLINNEQEDEIEVNSLELDREERRRKLQFAEVEQIA